MDGRRPCLRRRGGIEPSRGGVATGDHPAWRWLARSNAAQGLEITGGNRPAPFTALIVELDGGFVHRTWRTSERDREKDRLLQADGWRVVRVTWRQLRDDSSGVIADLRRLLRQ